MKIKKGDLFPASNPYSTLAPRGTYRIQYTGEYRKPKKGEWYISGAPPEGYYSPANLDYPIHIGKLVRVKIQTIVTVEDA